MGRNVHAWAAASMDRAGVHADDADVDDGSMVST
jgi:hypothetical protein